MLFLNPALAKTSGGISEKLTDKGIKSLITWYIDMINICHLYVDKTLLFRHVFILCRRNQHFLVKCR